MASPFIAYTTGQIVGLNIRLLEELTFLSGRDGFCQPSQTYLAEKLGVNRFTISRHLHQLQEAGMVAIQRRYHRTEGGQVRSKTNVYRVLTVAKMALKAVSDLFSGWASAEQKNSAPTELRQTAPVQQLRNKDQSADGKFSASPGGTKPKTADKKPRPWEKPAIYHQSHQLYNPNDAPAAPKMIPSETQELGSYVGKAKELAERFLQLGQGVRKPDTDRIGDRPIE